MKTHTANILRVLTALVTSSITAQCQYSYTSVDNPWAKPGLGAGTQAAGISGTNVVGYYRDSLGVYHGFLYAGSTYTNLDDPLAGTASGEGTFPNRISGTTIVGSYVDGTGVTHGFLFNGSNWITLDEPLAGPGGTYANGVSGTNIVGVYLDSSGVPHGFLYNESTWSTLDAPFAGTDPYPNGGTAAHEISGPNIVGWYIDGTGKSHGFLFNGSIWTTLDAPLARSEGTAAYGVWGSQVVGTYTDITNHLHGFLYDGSTWTTLDEPLGVNGTHINDISGSDIVGYYQDGLEATNGGHEHGFFAAPIPRLNITLSLHSEKVSWPFNPLIGWALQQAADLSSTNWTTVGGVQTDGMNYFITTNPITGNAFFRLNHQ